MKLLRDSQLQKIIKKDLRNLPIVQINWVDAATDRGWKPLEEHRQSGVAPTRSVGWLSKNNSKEIQVVQSISEFGTAGDPITIPKSWMLSYRVLKS